ncbi:MAG TPA: ABC transporter ATP-binding protein [Solirubrobacteraceae bacterium]|jgi:putative ABC transport system ATP-binding protein|nr:ABC transporter ATP-binding protein [Solirubrobacteraceae bacterium]
MLELEEACKRYVTPSEAIRAVDHISLTVLPGEFLAIFGPSGSGKSTLLSLASGLVSPDAGAVRFMGTDLTTLRKRDVLAYRRYQLGLVFQSFELVDGLTAEENVMLPLLVRKLARSETLQRARAALEEVGMSHRAGHRAESLSGGEQQRVAVARALIGRPKLVLADEPTGNLDSDTGETVLSLLHGLTRERDVATVLATHDAHAVRYADRVLEMRDGRLNEADVRV